MRKLGGFGVGICLLLAVFHPAAIKAEPEAPDVIINELAWAGSSVSSSDEWIELKNTTDADIDIAGWQITKDTSGNGSNETLMATMPITDDPELSVMHIIPAQGFFLIAHWGPAASALNVPPNYNTTSLTLSNTKLIVRLYKGPYLTAELADTAGNGGTPFYGTNIVHSYTSTMERNAQYELGDLKESWHEATASLNLKYIENAVNLGTPKTDNSIPAAAAPKISKIIPDQAEAETIWEADDIIGENFVVDGITQVKLEKGDSAIWATNVNVISPTTINTAKFDLHGAEAGIWDIAVINPDGQTATLPNAVEIIEPEEEPINPTYSQDIVLSELYPHPSSGQEEFIELCNTGNTSVNLKEWKLDDIYPGGSAVYIISNDTIIGPHQYLIFPKSQTHISLNDTGDFARLLWPNDTAIETTPNYGNATAGYSYSKINGSWEWSKRATPNAANIYESTAAEEDNPATSDSDPNSLQPNEINIELKANNITPTSVILTWKINLPGAIGDIKIYQSDKKGPLGNKIGETSSTASLYLVNNLAAKTKYFFTIVGSYNSADISSNQIEITTTGSQTSAGIGGSKGVTKQIIINEILPNPNAGDNEFIELFNPSGQSVDIAGWELRDASGKTYIMNVLDLEELVVAEENLAIVLGPNQYLLLEYPTTHIRLNNSGGEEIQLLDAEENLIDSVAYTGSVKPGEAYVLAPNGQWFWSNETTPGGANNISFASMDENDNFGLVNTGHHLRWMAIFWISSLFSVIMLSYLKRYGCPKLHHT